MSYRNMAIPTPEEMGMPPPRDIPVWERVAAVVQSIREGDVFLSTTWRDVEQNVEHVRAMFASAGWVCAVEKLDPAKCVNAPEKCWSITISPPRRTATEASH